MLIGGFQSLSLSDYPGHCAAIVFTRGCNFCCSYCHNRQLIDTGGETDDSNRILEQISQRKKLIDAVVITGGEPTIQPNLAEFAVAVQKLGLAVKLDTNGSRPDIVQSMIEMKLVDYIAMDVKAPPEKYGLLCGIDGFWPKIADSIDIISRSVITAEFRTTFVPDLLDEQDLEMIRNYLPDNCTYKIQEYVRKK